MIMKAKREMPLTLSPLDREGTRSCSLALEHIMLEGGQASESNLEYMVERSKEKPTVPQSTVDLFKLSEVTTFNADDLLGEDHTAHMILGTQVYILRKIRQNKLLLTK